MSIVPTISDENMQNAHFNGQFPGQPVAECQTILDSAAERYDGGGIGDSHKSSNNDHQHINIE